MFKERDEWWDVLCDISTGEVIISDAYRKVLESESSYKQMEQLDNAFLSRVLNGIDMRYTESWVRTQFSDLTEHLVFIALNCESFETPEAKQREEEGNSWRCKILQQTSAFATLSKRNHLEQTTNPHLSRIRMNVRKLQMTSSLTVEETRNIFHELESVLQKQRDVEILLGYLRPSLGGIFPICSHLGHQSAEVRRYAFRILSEIETCGTVGDSLMKGMNFFTMLLYLRASKEFGSEQYLGGSLD